MHSENSQPTPSDFFVTFGILGLIIGSINSGFLWQGSFVGSALTSIIGAMLMSGMHHTFKISLNRRDK